MWFRADGLIGGSAIRRRPQPAVRAHHEIFYRVLSTSLCMLRPKSLQSSCRNVRNSAGGYAPCGAMAGNRADPARLARGVAREPPSPPSPLSSACVGVHLRTRNQHRPRPRVRARARATHAVPRTRCARGLTETRRVAGALGGRRIFERRAGWPLCGPVRMRAPAQASAPSVGGVRLELGAWHAQLGRLAQRRSPRRHLRRRS